MSKELEKQLKQAIKRGSIRSFREAMAFINGYAAALGAELICSADEKADIATMVQNKGK